MMRTPMFDLVGMVLVALAVIATCGGMLTWAYVLQGRDRSGSTTDHTTSEGDDHAERPTVHP